MKRRPGRKTLMMLLAAFIISAGASGMAYANEPEPDDKDLSENESDYDGYEITDEDISEIEKSVSGSNAEAGRGGADYRSIRDPELKVSYDAGSGAFVYMMPNGGSFMINVPLGGITDEPVELTAGDETWIDAVYEDGISVLPAKEHYESMEELYASVSDDQILKVSVDNTGSYDFIMWSESVDRTGITVCSSTGGFRIARNDIPLWINRLTAPYAYEIGSASVDGRIINASGDSLELTEDGTYEVIFKPVKQGLPEWTSHFTRDTTAPVLTFTPALSGRTMDCPVSFIPSEAGARIKVFLNNREISLQNMTASADGSYRILVSDESGNENEYSFRIDMREKAPYTLYIYLLLLLTALAAFVIVTAHGRMRII